MVRTWDGLGDRGESNDRGPSSYKTRSSQLSSEADISNPATVKFKSGQWLRKPASTPAAYEPIRMTAGASKTRPPTEAASHVLISVNSTVLGGPSRTQQGRRSRWPVPNYAAKGRRVKRP